MAKETTYRRIAAVQKTCEIIRTLAAQKGAVSGPELARLVKLELGTVMCHLATLSDVGFVRQVGDGWELGMGLALIWARVKSGLETQLARTQADLDKIS